MAGRSAARRLKQFRNSLPLCHDVQEKLLIEIVRANQDSDFGRRHGFAGIAGYADFVAALPPANYDYFEPYIERCRCGDSSALFGPSEKLLMFALTSGTTARPKHIPVTQRFADHYRRGWNIWGVKALADHPGGYLRRILQVTSPAQQHESPAGIACGAISGMLARNQKLIVRRFYAAPYDVADITDASARYYAIMRFAIAGDVGFISTANPSTTLTLARTAEEHASSLIRDIHDGTLQPPGAMEGHVQRQLGRRLKANPRRARELDTLLHTHGRLLPMHYWNLAFIGNWIGGTLGLYVPELRDYFGDVPIRDIGLLASEARFSIPMDDNTASGVLDITSNFYEFIPADEMDAIADESASPTIDAKLTILRAHELQVGHDYYVLLTNTAGLYRYNIGDIVRVTGIEGTTPIIEFLSKGAHTSSITGEKLTENQVVNAVGAAVRELSLTLETFVMAPQWGQPPSYHLQCQAARSITPELLNRLGELTDRFLSQTNIEFESKRHSIRLGPISVSQVVAGCLTEQDDQLRHANAGRSEQFKHRFLYNEPLQSSSSRGNSESVDPMNTPAGDNAGIATGTNAPIESKIDAKQQQEMKPC